jgi:hypothetical protein
MSPSLCPIRRGASVRSGGAPARRDGTGGRSSSEAYDYDYEKIEYLFINLNINVVDSGLVVD